MTRKYRPKGIIKGGYGFLFCRKSRWITVMNMRTLLKVQIVAPESMVNTFDLRLWVDGFLAGKDKGWGAIL